MIFIDEFLPLFHHVQNAAFIRLQLRLERLQETQKPVTSGCRPREYEKRDTERERTGRKRRREEKRGKEGRGGRRRKEEEREGGRRGGGGEGRGMRIRAINRPGDPGFSSVNWWVLASWDLWRCESWLRSISILRWLSGWTVQRE